jgi:iron complex outermembrane recepter protein
MESRRSCLLTGLTLLAALGLPGLALAQETDEVVEAGVDVEVDTGEGEVIEITGTAIPRLETTTPAPVSTIDREEIDATGKMSIGEVLQRLPAQSNAINVQFNNGGDGSTRINLRGLGAGRTLVLLNGRRHVPGGLGANSSVDLNAIPLAIIERIEVLKDGASAVYGSDAIGGVVNVITRQDFEGTEATIFTGTTQRGDATTYDLSVVSGTRSSRGSFLVSGGFYQHGDIFAGDRVYSRLDKEFDFQCVADGGPATLYHPVNNPDGCINPLGSSATPFGVVIDYGEDGSAEWDAVIDSTCPSGACTLGPDGIRDFNASGNFPDTGDFYNYQPDNYLLTPQRRYNVYSQGRWKLARNTDAFFETSYTRRESDQLLAPEPLFTVVEGITVSGDNHYNPYDRAFIDIRRRMIEAGNRRFLQEQDTFRIVTGVEGDIPFNNWKWNAHYNFGRTSGVEFKEGLFVLSRVQNALGPSYVDGDGVAHCGTPGAEIPGCVPLDLFGGPGSITPEMLESITYTGIARGFTTLNSGQVGARGKLADTPWDGFVGLAVGGEYRHLAGESIPDPITASGDTTGNKAEPTGGSYNTLEGFAELGVVPIAGKPMAKWVELSAAARGHRFNNFGSGLTYKTGALWAIPEGVAVRGTYSTAFRAPSIGELFSGSFDSFPAVRDPCDTGQAPRTPNAEMNCAAQGIPGDHEDVRSQQRSILGGNPDAQPEKADIITAGIVYEPTFAPGLGLTLDHFWVNVRDSIQFKGAGQILNNCYNRSVPIQEDCDKIVRDPNTNLITFIDDRITNTGGNKTSGFDFQVRYDWRHPMVGRFRHNLEGTYLLKFNSIIEGGRFNQQGEPVDLIVEGKGIYDLGVHPSLKGNFSTLWGLGGFGAGFNVRYIGSFKECHQDDCETFLTPNTPGFAPELSRDVDANVTADLFGSYEMKSPAGVSRLTFGVNNVFDTDPAIIFNGFLATSDAATYDFLGRFFYVRFTQMY